MPVTSAVDPLVSQHRLLLELRQAREAAGLSQRDVAAALDWSESKVIRAENGTVGISLTDLRALLDLYRVPAANADRLIEMARTVRARRRRTEQESRAVSRDFRLFLAYERSATDLAFFNPLLVPGLLQTEAYARAVLRDGFVVPAEHVDDKVAIRLERQREVFGRDEPARIDVVLDEAVIRRPVGGPSVMRGQLARLLELQRRPGVSIRVIPFEAGLYPGISGPFTLLEAEAALTPPVVYLETPTSDTTVRHDPGTVVAYRDAFDRLRARALDARGSARLIESAVGTPGAQRAGAGAD
jgi:transcriptional regulator with XRE-family HTH domain